MTFSSLVEFREEPKEKFTPNSPFSETFPANLGDLEELEELYAGNTAIWQLPYSVQQLSRLTVLSSRRGWKGRSKSPGSLVHPISLNGLSELKRLDLSGCNVFCEEELKELYAEDFLGIESIVALRTFLILFLVSFTNYSFDHQPYMEKSIDSSVLEQILSFFLSDAKVNVGYLLNYGRNGISIIFPGCEIPTWFKHQSIGFAICCVTCMGAGVYDPGSRLSGKYDYTSIKAKLICNNNPEKPEVLEKECKVGTASRTCGWYVCFAYIPLYFLLQVSGADARNLSQYCLFKASINNRIARQWEVHLVYKT
ncbi:hypothetical protein P3S68_013957 [Capsicum galapagoense]